MNSKFTWISLYNELSDWLLLQRDNQPELISILKEIGITGFRDGSERGREIELEEMDPFTFFSYLNKFHSDERQIIKKLVDACPSDEWREILNARYSNWLKSQKQNF